MDRVGANGADIPRQIVSLPLLPARNISRQKPLKTYHFYTLKGKADLQGWDGEVAIYFTVCRTFKGRRGSAVCNAQATPLTHKTDGCDAMDASFVTLDLYSHVIPGMQEDAAAMVDTALKSAIQKRQEKQW